MCLVLGDIDNFKPIDDAFGHVMGDEILKRVARVLEENVRARDTLARYGGEEFAVILPHTEIEAATQLTERVRGLLEAKHLVVSESGRDIGTLTASFGIAELREGAPPRQRRHAGDRSPYARRAPQASRRWQ
jgi:diguanylate cyclase